MPITEGRVQVVPSNQRYYGWCPEVTHGSPAPPRESLLTCGIFGTSPTREGACRQITKFLAQEKPLPGHYRQHIQLTDEGWSWFLGVYDGPVHYNRDYDE